MFKKVLLGLGTAIVLGAGSFALVNADNAGGSASVNGNEFNTSAGFGANGGGGIMVGGTSSNQGSKLIQIVKNFINRVLGILSLVVLVIVLIGGFQMVTAQGDENKYKKGFTILKHAGIGLVVIGLSWFIVSIIFWIIGSAGTNSADGSVSS